MVCAFQSKCLCVTVKGVNECNKNFSSNFNRSACQNNPKNTKIKLTFENEVAYNDLDFPNDLSDMYFGEKSCEIFTFNKVRKIHKNLALIISKLLLLLLLFLFLVF